MRLLIRTLVIVLAFSPILTLPVRASAADVATPAWSDTPDLPTLTLRPADLDEVGWAHEGAFVQTMSGQAEAHAEYVGASVEDVESRLATAGWERQYVHVLRRASDDDTVSPSRRIRSYVTLYDEPSGAAAGFTYLEDESTIPSAEDVATSRDIGEESELTVELGTTQTDGRAYRSLDLTFRTGPLVGGVTLITYTDGETDASPESAPFDLGADQELVERLAGVLEQRLSTPGSAGPALGARVLRLDSDAHDVVTFDDAYYRMAGEDIPLADERSAAERLRTATYADATDVYQLWQSVDTASPAGVLVGVTLLRFSEEQAAEAWVTDLESILAANPFYGDLQYEAGAVTGDLGAQSVALSYVAGGGAGDAPRALLVAVRVGEVVARVHLVPQGTMPSIEPIAMAELADAQGRCLQSSPGTEMAPVPQALVVALADAQEPEATPIASPIAHQPVQ